MNAVGYARVSTTDQAREGVSLEVQESRFRAWCEATGTEPVGFFRDAGLSGGRADNRPGLQAAIKAARKSKAVLVVYSLSRLARSTKDAILIAEDLNKAGADLVSLTEKIDTTSPTGKAFFTIMAAMAQLERDQIAERTAAAMAHLRKQGRRISSKIPFGFDLSEDGRYLIPNPREREAVELMHSLRADGRTLRHIATELERRGVHAKYSDHWSAQAVRGILKRHAA